jgi:hypothetical protein
VYLAGPGFFAVCAVGCFAVVGEEFWVVVFYQLLGY